MKLLESPAICLQKGKDGNCLSTDMTLKFIWKRQVEYISNSYKIPNSILGNLVTALLSDNVFLIHFLSIYVIFQMWVN